MPTDNKPDSEEAPESSAAEPNSDAEKSCASENDANTPLESTNEVTDRSDSEATKSADDEDFEPTEIELLKAQVDELSKKLIDTETQLSESQKDVNYAKAETQTVIRRGREDTARALNRSKRDLMSRLINVADTFQHTSGELKNFEKDEKSEIVVTAVEMAIKEFDKVLGGEGLEVLNPEGETFDPQFHEAQAMVPVADKEPGTVIDVLRVGYLLDGNLLRAPQVVVVAEPKTEESEVAPEDE